ncbi:MAG TPA: 2-oxoglutarate dehydrogenase E1 component, partial [Chloroflexota bacterium]|nr:2-oxoglutarate dehydrogenase E1 component [Chloroflexota bacterium]
MDLWREFHGPNAAYLLELFAQYEQNPASLDKTTQTFFQQNAAQIRQIIAGGNGAAPSTGSGQDAVSLPTEKIMGAVNLAQAIREFGHLAARLDPLGTEPPGEPSLALDYHGLTADDLRQLPARLI